jgi:hypothetical protein
MYTTVVRELKTEIALLLVVEIKISAFGARSVARLGLALGTPVPFE